MKLQPGTQLGPYQIVSAVGAGGMGEVYRARDTRLERSVAVKIIPREQASNARMRLRFEREAKTISQLNHPNICAVYDVGEIESDSAEPVQYLVMELLEGETLADRLARGPLSLDQLIVIGSEIASALDQAHRSNVIHRDLKPGNIMLTRSGAKLLDFGLSKATLSSDAMSAESLTHHKPLTEEGTILGTIPYMSPEQLEGEEADAQSDIFALGATLFEMATGKRAFAGSSRASLMAAILQSEPPPLEQLRGDLPAGLERIVRNCLAKDRRLRWASAHDVALALRTLTVGGTPSTRRVPRFKLAVIALASIAAGALATFALMQLRSPQVVEKRTQFALFSPPSTEFGDDVETVNGALSASGRYFLTVVMSGGIGRLALHDFESGAARIIGGTEGARGPFWSPDEKRFGFFVDGNMKTMSVAGGPIETITPVAKRSAQASWSRNGQIVFTTDHFGVLKIVGERGGEARILSTTGKDDWIGWPHFLPDGVHFLAVRGTAKSTSIVVGSTESPELSVIVERTDSFPVYAEPGHILFVRDESLLSLPFDTRRLKVSGEARVVATDVPSFSPIAWAPIAASTSGRIAYGYRDPKSRVTVVDDRGRELSEVLPAASYGSMALSPDGRKLAFEIPDAATKTSEIWIRDRSRGVTSRLSINPEYFDSAPVWSPDGSAIVYASHGGTDASHLRSQKVGESNATVLFKGGLPFPSSWSPDGTHILFGRISSSTQQDIWVIDVSTNKASPLIATEFNEREARFSPDGRWIAYSSDESGRSEIYVQASEGGRRFQISSGGGHSPRWSNDGNMLYFLGSDRTLMSARTANRPADFDGASGERLFRLPIATEADPYDILDGGKNFLILGPTATDRGTLWNVIDHWAAGVAAGD